MDISRITKGAAALLLFGSLAVGPIAAQPNRYGQPGRYGEERNERNRNERYRNEGRYGRYQAQQNIVVSGRVYNLNLRGHTFVLRSQGRQYMVFVPRDTTILNRGAAARWRDMRDGGIVRVHGVLNPQTGRIVATRVDGFGYGRR